MNLQSYIADFIDIVNNIFIPFMLGIAFLVFVINVFRFFVVGGSNTDSQEKAKRLAIYGVGAFVFIIIFWGIVNLLTTSFGLQRLGESASRCFDYGPSECGGIAGDFGGVSDGFGTGIGDPRSPGLGDASGFPNTPVFNTPTQPTTPTIPDFPTAPPAPPTVNTDAFPELSEDMIEASASANIARAVVGEVADAFTADISELYDWRIQPIVEEAVVAISDPFATNEERAIAAIRLTNYNQLTENDLGAYIGTLNSEQTANSQPPLDMQSLRTEAAEPSTDRLERQIEFTQQALQPLFISSNQSFLDWGEPNEAAQTAGAAELASVYQLPADLSRVAAFDTIVNDGGFPSGQSMFLLRTRLVNDINGERFFAGLPPLAE